MWLWQTVALSLPPNDAIPSTLRAVVPWDARINDRRPRVERKAGGARPAHRAGMSGTIDAASDRAKRIESGSGRVGQSLIRYNLVRDHHRDTELQRIYGLYGYGLCSYGLCSYGLCSYGL